jgi:hypothetical protein
MSKQGGGGGRGRPKLFHPLCGAGTLTLLRVLARHGLPLRHLPEIVIALAVSVLRAPFSLAEHLYTLAERPRLGVKEAPVFILGHWRSGTTHLYNVMSKAHAFGYVSPFATALPWDFLLLGRLFEPVLKKALPEHRFIDSIPVEPDSPQEDEIGLANMTPHSFYHGLYFPRRFEETFNAGVFFDGLTQDEVARWQRLVRYYFDKLSIGQGGRRLLIKNPVYTARVAILRALWPEAKFIHIHRNPYKVFVSMRNFYAQLFRELALEPYQHVDIDNFILATYRRMMDTYTKESAGLPPHQLVELSFEDFQKAPMTELKRIYATLSLPGFAEAEPRFARYLDSVREYRKNVYSFPAEAKERVSRHWQTYIERWSYLPPA